MLGMGSGIMDYIKGKMNKKKNEQVKNFTLLFLTQVLMYTLLCINYRSVADGHYIHSMISDGLIACTSFFVIKKIAQSEDQGFWLWLGYTLGSMVGSIIGIWIHKELLTT